MERRYFLGLDLGQAQDYTALAVVEQEIARGGDSNYAVRFVHRFGQRTSYPKIVEVVKAVCEDRQLGQNANLVIDGTGVGRAVVDQFVQSGLPCGLVAVSIHGGDQVTKDGLYYRVPKRHLVGVLQVLLQNRRVKVAKRLPLTDVLVAELDNFKVKIDPVTAHDSYAAWREGEHDDLVLALALALWYAEQGAGWLVTGDYPDDPAENDELWTPIRGW